ncbi:MAG: RIP metalloprotease RseP, partial [Candidatus Brocadiia bacterium]
VNSFTDIQQDVALSRIGTPMAFEIEREGKTITLNVASEKNAGDLFPTIGIQPPTSNILHADTSELTSAGFQTGDTILSVNGKPVGDFNAGDTINGEILASPNKEVTFIVKRGEAEHTILVTPRPIYSYLLDAAIMPAIGSVEPDLPAAKAGILAGDYIIEIAGQRMEGFESIVKAISGAEGEVSITVLRGVERREFKMTPIANDKEGRKMVGIRVNPDEPRYRAIWVTKGSTAEQAGLKEGDYIKSFTLNNMDGFADIKLESGGEVRFTARRDDSVTPVGLFGVNLLYKQEIIRAKSIGEAFSRGWNDCVQIVDKTYLFLAKLLSAQVSAKLVSGPVGIVNISYKVLSVGVMVFLHFLVLISINLAVVNLLPLPILDGGNIVMLAIEWIRGKPLSIKVQQVVVQVGLVLILGIFLLATGNDIYHLIFGY